METVSALAATARLYGLLDTAYVAPARWVEVCEALLDGGVDLLQLRAKRETPAERAALLDLVYERVRRRGVPLIVNDHLDLALARPGLGLHLGQDDDPGPEEARRLLGPGRLLGLSTHSVAQLGAARRLPAGVLDYFAVGPVYPTATKPDYAAVGLELVRAAAAGDVAGALPWFAIGGVNRRTVREVRDAGARRVVVVSDLLLAADPAGAARALRAALG